MTIPEFWRMMWEISPWQAFKFAVIDDIVVLCRLWYVWVILILINLALNWFVRGRRS